MRFHFIFFFFFNDTATTEIYTLSLHDALPISNSSRVIVAGVLPQKGYQLLRVDTQKLISLLDRKSTRLNSSHTVISYAVFCLKKKSYFSRMRDQVHNLIAITYTIVRAGTCWAW